MDFFFDNKIVNIPLDEIDYDGIYKNAKSRYAEEVGIEELAEHIEKNEFLNALSQIENKANKLIIFGMPHGEEIQEAVYGNKFEEHVSAWYSNEWKDLGYSTIVINDRIPGHITSYKLIS